MGWSTGPVSDLAGRWVLENVPDSYSHAGFVYCDGAEGVLIACGGDDAIVVGVYADHDALCEGAPLVFRSWTDATGRADAVSFIRGWLSGVGSLISF